jgi:hypothetical protein
MAVTLSVVLPGCWVGEKSACAYWRDDALPALIRQQLRDQELDASDDDQIREAIAAAKVKYPPPLDCKYTLKDFREQESR